MAAFLAINRVAVQRFDLTTVKLIVDLAVPDIQRQPRRFVRQAVVVEAGRVIETEQENTRELLHTVEGLAPSGEMRALVKLASATISAIH
ncbi:hypothetical protein [Bradyrhizobium sp. USDA 4516]